LSSRYEGFPTVLFEAITLKKTLLPQMFLELRNVRKRKIGLIVENSEEGIYQGMKKALTNPEYFEKYQENLKDYQMPFNLENSVILYLKL
jgi:glycosyltransferase involved in cell wall biosynthesis